MVDVHALESEYVLLLVLFSTVFEVPFESCFGGFLLVSVGDLVYPMERAGLFVLWWEHRLRYPGATSHVFI